MDTSTPTQRDIAAHHEAGHAVAATMRGDSSVTSVELGEMHGTGLTWTRSKGFDSAFVAWAGPWAEARFIWPDGQDLTTVDEQGRTFLEVVDIALGLQPADHAPVVAEESRLATIQPPEGMEHQALLRDQYRVWSDELHGVWPAIRWVAEALLDQRTLSDAEVRQALEVARYAFLHWTS